MRVNNLAVQAYWLQGKNLIIQRRDFLNYRELRWNMTQVEILVSRDNDLEEKLWKPCQPIRVLYLRSSKLWRFQVLLTEDEA